MWRKSHILRVWLISSGAAILAALLFIWYKGDASLAQFGWTFVYSVVYSYTIGGLVGTLLVPMGPYISCRPFPVNWLLLILVLLLLTAAGCLLAGAILLLLGRSAADSFWLDFYLTYRIAAIITILVGGSAFFYETLRSEQLETAEQLRAKRLEEERARALATEARLSSLESRIHPHFLFNTLNSIASLIPEDPKRAEDMVVRLAALLRFSLDTSRTNLVELGHELKIVGDYLEIEKERFGDRLRYSIEVPEELHPLAVPPLALQTLVENSIKHAVAGRREGGEVVVSARSENGRLWLEVADNGTGFEAESLPPDRGLDNLRSRLAMLFGGEGRIETTRRGPFSVVSVSLPPGETRTGDA